MTGFVLHSFVKKLVWWRKAKWDVLFIV